jgi:hypothetical protein
MINIKGKTIYGPNVVTSGLVLYLDAANPRSYSPNAYPAPLDIFSYMGSNANAATITRDTAESSPAGGSALKMAITGNDPYTASYASSQFSFTTVASGQAWTVSCWIRASTATTAGFFIFGADNTGNWIEGWNQMFSITTSWQRFSYTYTFSNANTVAMQLRFDGVDSGGSGINVWFDGLQVERNSTATTFNSRYNQNANNWLDLSKSGYTSLLVKGPVASNLGITLDGVNDYAYISHGGALAFNTGNFTVCVWNRDNTNPTAQYAGIITNDDATDDTWKIFKDIGNTYYTARSFNKTVPFNNYTVNKFHMYAYTFNSGTVTTYFDGNPTGNSETGASNPVSRNNIAFGSYRYQDAINGNYLHNQTIGPTMLYNRALTSTEILQNYTAMKSKFL